MNGKLIFQETTRRKLPWNTNLPTDIRNDWNTWTDLMNTDSQVSMTRCLIPPEYVDGAYELHVLSDASSQAYGRLEMSEQTWKHTCIHGMQQEQSLSYQIYIHNTKTRTSGCSSVNYTREVYQKSIVNRSTSYIILDRQHDSSRLYKK